jgi:hypothetical protein
MNSYNLIVYKDGQVFIEIRSKTKKKEYDTFGYFQIQLDDNDFDNFVVYTTEPLIILSNVEIKKHSFLDDIRVGDRKLNISDTEKINQIFGTNNKSSRGIFVVTDNGVNFRSYRQLTETPSRVYSPYVKPMISITGNMRSSNDITEIETDIICKGKVGSFIGEFCYEIIAPNQFEDIDDIKISNKKTSIIPFLILKPLYTKDYSIKLNISKLSFYNKQSAITITPGRSSYSREKSVSPETSESFAREGAYTSSMPSQQSQSKDGGIYDVVDKPFILDSQIYSNKFILPMELGAENVLSNVYSWTLFGELHNDDSRATLEIIRRPEIVLFFDGEFKPKVSGRTNLFMINDKNEKMDIGNRGEYIKEDTLVDYFDMGKDVDIEYCISKIEKSTKGKYTEYQIELDVYNHSQKPKSFLIIQYHGSYQQEEQTSEVSPDRGKVTTSERNPDRSVKQSHETNSSTKSEKSLQQQQQPRELELLPLHIFRNMSKLSKIISINERDFISSYHIFLCKINVAKKGKSQKFYYKYKTLLQ